MASPSIFVSYSHDSKEHRNWVIKLATDLRSNGVDATLDVWDLGPGQDTSLFMQKGISASDRVLLVCSESYVVKAEQGLGGVGFERLIVTREVVESIDTKKFIPVIRNNLRSSLTPNFLGPRFYIDFRSDESYQEKLEDLLRELYGAPKIPKPELGSSPFSGQLQNPERAERVAGPTGVTASGQRVLDEGWFEKEREVSDAGLTKLGYGASTELRFGLHDGIQKSQIELLDSARKSQITTFGWPIGVILENREEYKPRPYGDGIRAEIAVAPEEDGDRKSYDYWALRSNGDFYLRQSLFEDERDSTAIFFNTRIVRITEALLYASNLYANLGLPLEVKLNVRVAHRGIDGRTLKSSNFNRTLRSRSKAVESNSQTEIALSLGELKSNLGGNVEKILSPLFMLFDFASFSSDVYSDIANRFASGQVT
jgi:hypothetical protein